MVFFFNSAARRSRENFKYSGKKVIRWKTTELLNKSFMEKNFLLFLFLRAFPENISCMYSLDKNQQFIEQKGE